MALANFVQAANRINGRDTRCNIFYTKAAIICLHAHTPPLPITVYLDWGQERELQTPPAYEVCRGLLNYRK